MIKFIKKIKSFTSNIKKSHAIVAIVFFILGVIIAQ